MTQSTQPDSRVDQTESGEGNAGAAETRSGQGDASVGYPWTPPSLVALRRDTTRRRAALVVAAVLGLGLAWLHWLGLVLAGALLALPSRSVARAVGAGLTFGALALAVFLLASSTMSSGEFLGLEPVSFLAIGIALVSPTWGSLVRATL